LYILRRLHSLAAVGAILQHFYAALSTITASAASSGALR
jgi:hypothetical protein